LKVAHGTTDYRGTIGGDIARSSRSRPDDHEQFVIEFEGKPGATLGPTEDAGITWREFAVRYATLPRPDDAFADDLEAIHTSQRPTNRN